MYKVFKYRLYPTKRQTQQLESILETCRHWYNHCLEERRTAYNERQEFIGRYDQHAKINAYRATNQWAANLNTNILRRVVDDLDQAFRAFFRRVRAGQQPGFPRFKSRNRFRSFGLKQYGNGYKIDGRRLRITGVGRIAVRWHRPLDGKIKTIRIVKRADHWYVSFTCETEPTILPATGREVGIDLGISNLLTTSDGEHITNAKWFQSQQRKLRVLSRRVSRRTRGSNNWHKAVVQLQRHHRRVVDQRRDYLNKSVLTLIRAYDRIAIENLQIGNMVYNRYLAKSIFDAGWGYFARHLASKAEEAGRQVCFVAPSYTSKTCSNCGRVVESQTLKERWFQCQCGLSLDRDHNAAINILKRAGRVRWSISSSIDGLGQEPAT
jgi:putative transposase